MCAESSIPQKRPRTDSQRESKVSPGHSLEFWYADGSIVLVAGNEAFRVHHGVLSQHSGVFRDMLALPQTGEETETDIIDGCAVVRLSDSSDQLRIMLRAIYKNRTYFKSDEVVEFCDLAVLVRICHKYQVDEIEAEALKRMQTCFTTSYDTWKKENVIVKGRTSVMSFEPSDAIVAVNLARLTDTPKMLPIAMYLCCQLGVQALLQGAPQEEGANGRLSSNDLAQCLNGRSKLLKEGMRMLRRTLLPVRSRCQDMYGLCFQERVKVLEAVEDAPAATHCNALLSRLPSITVHSRDRSICKSCADQIKSDDRMYREQIWDMLPDIFDLQEVAGAWTKVRG